MTKYYIVFVFGLLANCLFAQSYNFDVPVVNKPYFDIHLFDSNHKEGVQSELVISTDFSHPVQPKVDTIRIVHYDRKGQEIKSVSYRDNIPSGVTVTNWKDGQKTSVKSYHMPGMKLYTLSLFQYDSVQNLTQRMSFSISGKDTSSYQCLQYQYDNYQNLVEKQLYGSATRAHLFDIYRQKAVFSYDSLNRLIKHSHTNGDSDASLNPVSHYYYSALSLDSILMVYHTDSTDVQYDYQYVKYDTNGHLIYTEDPIGSWVGDEERNGTNRYFYTYNDNGDLASAYSMRKADTIVRATYHFDHGILQAYTSTQINRGTSMLSPFFLHFVKTVTIKYQRNDKNHWIKKEIFYDEELTKIITKHYTYY